MKIPRAPHLWSVTPKRAVQIQRDLAGKIVRTGGVSRLSLVAGADLAFLRGLARNADRESVALRGSARAKARGFVEGDECIAGVVVWDVRARQVVEQHVAYRPVRFPYIPGLLSFREAPALVAVLRKLRCEVDVFMFDGQGLAHPRRFGLACHVGLLIDRPSLGCAKSLLVGGCEPPRHTKGSTTPLKHHGERIGMAVRTRDGVKPVYVSLGHRLSLPAAVEVTLASCNGYRLPEPIRLADQLVAREKRRSR